MKFPSRIQYDGTAETAVLNLTTTPIGWVIWGVVAGSLCYYGIKSGIAYMKKN
jgi:hypothetical protein